METKEMQKWLAKLHKDSVNAGYAFRTPEELKQAENLGFIEVNRDIVDELDTMFACRITESGLEFAGISTANANDPSPSTPKKGTKMEETTTPSIVIEDGVPMPEKVRKSGTRKPGARKYPFDQLEVGQSFFVADRADGKKAKEILNPSVVAATLRYAVASEEKRINRKGNEVPVMIPTRVFEVREVEGGARVWRMQ